MVPEFSEAADKLKKGEFTKEPVKTQFGYHVIYLEDERGRVFKVLMRLNLRIKGHFVTLGPKILIGPLILRNRGSNWNFKDGRFQKN